MEKSLQARHCIACPIRKLALFQPLTRTQVETAQKYKTEHREVPPGTQLFSQNEACEEVYTLYDGWVFLYKEIAHGKRQILRFCLPGDLLGFHGDLGGGVHQHSAQSLTKTVLCVFPHSKLVKMFRKHPKLGVRLTWMTAHDNVLAHEHLATLGRRSARDKITHLLLELFFRVRLRRSDRNQENTIDFPLTQELIGDALGLTAIHVNRTIMELRRTGMVEIKSKKLTIPDPEALSELTAFNRKIHLQRPII
jgi:CRP-like cAMP-binding protein